MTGVERIIPKKPKRIKIIERLHDDVEWIYDYSKNLTNDLYRTEDGEEYSLADIINFRKNMIREGTLISYEELDDFF